MTGDRFKRLAPRIALTSLLAFVMACAGVPVPALAELVDEVGGEPGAQVAEVESGETADKVNIQSDGVAQSSASGRLEDGSFKSHGFSTLIQEGHYPEDRTSVLSVQQESFDASAAKAALLQGLMQCSEQIDLSGFGIPLEQIESVYSQVVNENPQLFYVGGGFEYGYSGSEATGYTVLSFTPSYNYPVESIPAMQQDYEAAVSEVLSWVPSGASTLQKAKAVHDWLVRNLTYDDDAAEKMDPNEVGWTPWNAYGALVAKKCVCQGYTLAFMDLMRRMDVTCATMTNASAAHVWNGVHEGSYWYIVDVTWDDPTYQDAEGTVLGDGGFNLDYSNGLPHTEYFMKSRAAAMDADGLTDGTHSTWTPENIVCDSTSYDSVDANALWGNYSAPASQSVITPCDLSEGNIDVSPKTYTYTGVDIVPDSVVVTYNGNVLSEDDDYTISIIGNKDVGSATVTVTGKGAYTGSLSESFQIIPKTVGLEWGLTAFTYDGAAHKPTAVATGLLGSDACGVTVGGEATDAGQYTAMATGLSNGNYQLPSTTTTSFSIAQREAQLVWGNTTLPYTGNAQVPTATVGNIIDGDTCVVGVEGAQCDPGTYEAKAVSLSNDNYALPIVVTKQFEITSSLAVTATGYTDAYDGEGHGIAVSAPEGATVLYGTSVDSCTLAQSPTRTEVGTTTVYYRVFKSGHDDVEGSADIVIAPREVGLAWSGTTHTYDGGSWLPAVTATGLVDGDSCDVTVEGSQVAAGTYVATATSVSNGNYRLPEDASTAFTIARRPVRVKACDASKTYRHGDPALSATVEGTLGSDTVSYRLSRASGEAAGKYAITASGNAEQGNYAVTYVPGTLTITRASIASAEVSVAAQTFTGGALAPKPTVRVGGVTLREGTDYALAYANNVNAGTATITVTGRGNYAGSKSATFAISKAANGVTAKAGSVREVLFNAAKKKAQTIASGVSVKGANGAVTYRKVSGSTQLSVNAKNGKVTVKKGTKKGTYKVKIRVSAAGDANHDAGSRDVVVTVKVVAKYTNPITVKAANRVAKVAQTKKKAVTMARPLSVSGAKGKVTYAKAGGAKQLTVNKGNGKVTVKKGTKKGTYKIKIKVTAAGNGTYNKGTKTVTCTVVVQ